MRSRRSKSFLLFVVGLASCGVREVHEPQVVRLPVKNQSTTSVAGFEQSRSFPVRIYFLRKNRFEFLERRDSAETDPTVAVRNAFANLQGGLSLREKEQGFSSPMVAILQDAAFTVDINVRQGIAEVDISESAQLLRSLSPQSRDLVLAQISLTILQSTPGVGGLRFVSAGTVLEAKTAGGTRNLLHVDDIACASESPTCDLPSLIIPQPVSLPDVISDSVADSVADSAPNSVLIQEPGTTSQTSQP
jgi:hypothetical protein